MVQSTKAELKIVVAGSVGSGKSTSIRTVSETPVIGTEARASERDALRRKETTTTAMEYGTTHVADTKLHLYGTPGQRRFDFMGDILLKGANGMVIMIDNGCSDPLNEIGYYLNRYAEFLKKHFGVIAITHFDDNNTRTNLIEYHAYVKQHGFNCPLMILDAREENQVKKVLARLLRVANSQPVMKPVFESRHAMAV